MKTLAARSLELFTTKYYCAESILLAAAEKLQIESEIIPKIATGFCSGLARTNGTCGAVNGAIMAISLFSGNSDGVDNREKNYPMVQLFIEEFSARYGTINCTDLLGCSLGNEEGQKYFAENNKIKTCEDIIKFSADILEKIIDESRQGE